MKHTFFELVARRRSSRRFTGESISDTLVESIVRTALLAPSSWGGYPVEFELLRISKK